VKPHRYYVEWEDTAALEKAIAAVGGNVDKLRGDEALRGCGFDTYDGAVFFAGMLPTRAVLWERYDITPLGEADWDWKERQLDLPNKR
jgi:hypothetical protein